jgi:hypothetical protein
MARVYLALQGQRRLGQRTRFVESPGMGQGGRQQRRRVDRLDQVGVEARVTRAMCRKMACSCQTA